MVFYTPELKAIEGGRNIVVDLVGTKLCLPIGEFGINPEIWVW
jgi:hypothetical protein